MDFLAVAAGVVVVTTMGAISAAVVYWFNRKVGVDVAQDKYIDALEGELELSNTRYSRLEAELATIQSQTAELTARVAALQAELAETMRENDRLRAENIRLREKLRSMGAEDA